MSKSTTDTRIVPLAPGRDVLTGLLRDGPQRLMAQAIEAEVAARSSATATFPSGPSRLATGQGHHALFATIW